MIIISAKSGQLGNRLFNFANFIGFAAENKTKLINPCFEEYANHFETTSKDVMCRFPAKLGLTKFKVSSKKRHYLYRLVLLLVKLIDKYKLNGKLVRHIHCQKNSIYLLDDSDAATIPFKKTGFVFVSGLNFRDISHIRKYLPDIRAYFTPIEQHRVNVENLIKIARAECDVLIGIHIRAGDYSQHLGGKFCYGIEDYLGFMRQVLSLFPHQRVAFMVCSNGDLQREAFEEFNYLFGNNDFVEDMYVFAKCDYLLGAPSTYTLWACLYGDVPLCFVHDPNEKISLSKFQDYFTHVGKTKTNVDTNGEQYVTINGERYDIQFKTDKSYLEI